MSLSTLSALNRSEAPYTSNQCLFHVEGLPEVVFCASAVNGATVIVRQASSGLKPFQPAEQQQQQQGLPTGPPTAAGVQSTGPAGAAAAGPEYSAAWPYAGTVAADSRDRFESVLLVNEAVTFGDEPILQLAWGGGPHHVLAAASKQIVSFISLSPFIHSLAARQASAAASIQLQQQEQQQQQQAPSNNAGRNGVRFVHAPSIAYRTMHTYRNAAALLALQWTYDAAGLLATDTAGNLMMLSLQQQSHHHQQQQQWSLCEVWRAHAQSPHAVVAAGASPHSPSASVSVDNAQRVTVWWPRQQEEGGMQDPSYQVGAEIIRHPVPAVYIQWSPPLQQPQQQDSSSSSSSNNGWGQKGSSRGSSSGGSSAAEGPGSPRGAKATAAAAAAAAIATGKAGSDPETAGVAADVSGGGSSSSSGTRGHAALMTVGTDGIIRIFVEVVMSDIMPVIGATLGTAASKAAPKTPAAAAAGVTLTAAAAGRTPSTQPAATAAVATTLATMSQFCLTLVIQPPGLSPQALQLKPGLTACWARPLEPCTPGQSGMLWLLGSYVAPAVTGPMPVAAALSGTTAAVAATAVPAAAGAADISNCLQLAMGGQVSHSSQQHAELQQSQKQRQGGVHQDHVYLWAVDGLHAVTLSGIAQRAIVSNKVSQPRVWCWGSDSSSIRWQQPGLLVNQAVVAGLPAAAGLSNGKAAAVLGFGALPCSSLAVWVVETAAGPLLSALQQFHTPYWSDSSSESRSTTGFLGSANNVVGVGGQSLLASSSSQSVYSECRCYQVTPLSGVNESGQPASAIAVDIRAAASVFGPSDEWIQLSVHAAAGVAATVSSRGPVAIWGLNPTHILPMQLQQQQQQGNWSQQLQKQQQQQQALPASWHRCQAACWLAFGSVAASAAAAAAEITSLPLLLALHGPDEIDLCLITLAAAQPNSNTRQCSRVHVAAVQVLVQLQLPAGGVSIKQLIEVAASPGMAASSAVLSLQSSMEQAKEQQQRAQHKEQGSALLLNSQLVGTAELNNQQQQQQEQHSLLGSQLAGHGSNGAASQGLWVSWAVQLQASTTPSVTAAASAYNIAASGMSWQLVTSQPQVTAVAPAAAAAAGDVIQNSSNCGAAATDHGDGSSAAAAAAAAITCVHCPSPASPFLVTGDAAGVLTVWQVLPPAAAAAAGVAASSVSGNTTALGCDDSSASAGGVAGCSVQQGVGLGPRLQIIQACECSVAGVQLGGIAVAVAMSATAGYAAVAVTCGQSDLEDVVLLWCAEGLTQLRPSQHTRLSSQQQQRQQQQSSHPSVPGSNSIQEAGGCSTGDTGAAVYALECLLPLDDTAAALAWCDTGGLIPLLLVGTASGAIEMYSRQYSGQWTALAVYQAGVSIRSIAADSMGLPLILAGSQLLLLTNLAALTAAAAAAPAAGGASNSPVDNTKAALAVPAGDAAATEGPQQAAYSLVPLDPASSKSGISSSSSSGRFDHFCSLSVSHGPARGALLSLPELPLVTHMALAAATAAAAMADGRNSIQQHLPHTAATGGSSSLPLYHPNVLGVLLGQGKLAAVVQVLRRLLLFLRQCQRQLGYDASDKQQQQQQQQQQQMSISISAVVPLAAVLDAGDMWLAHSSGATSCHMFLGSLCAVAAGVNADSSQTHIAQQHPQQQQHSSFHYSGNSPAAHQTGGTIQQSLPALTTVAITERYGIKNSNSDDQHRPTAAAIPAQAGASVSVPATNASVSAAAGGNALDTGMLDMSAFGGFGIGDDNDGLDDIADGDGNSGVPTEQGMSAQQQQQPKGSSSSVGAHTAHGWGDALDTGMLDMSAFGGFGFGGDNERWSDDNNDDREIPASMVQSMPAQQQQQQELQQQPLTAATGLGQHASTRHGHSATRDTHPDSGATTAATTGGSGGAAGSAELETEMLDMAAFGMLGGLGDGLLAASPPQQQQQQQQTQPQPQQQQRRHEQHDVPAEHQQQQGSDNGQQQIDDTLAAGMSQQCLDLDTLATTTAVFPTPQHPEGSKPAKAAVKGGSGQQQRQQLSLLSPQEVQDLHQLLSIVPLNQGSSSSKITGRLASSISYYAGVLQAAGAAGSEQQLPLISDGNSSSITAGDQTFALRTAQILRVLGLSPEQAQKLGFIADVVSSTISLDSESSTSDRGHGFAVPQSADEPASAAALAAKWAAGESSGAYYTGRQLTGGFSSSSSTSKAVDDASSNSSSSNLLHNLDAAGRVFVVNAHLTTLEHLAKAAAAATVTTAEAGGAAAKQQRDRRVAAAVRRVFQPVNVTRSSAAAGSRGAALLAHYPTAHNIAAAAGPPGSSLDAGPDQVADSAVSPRSRQLYMGLVGSKSLGRSATGKGLLAGLSGQRSNSSSRIRRGSRALGAAMHSSVSVHSMLSFSSLKDVAGDSSDGSFEAAAAAASGGNTSAATDWAGSVGLLPGITPLLCLWATACSTQGLLLDVLLPLLPDNLQQQQQGDSSSTGMAEGDRSGARSGFMSAAQQQSQVLTWPKLRALGAGFWLTEPSTLRSTAEGLAKAQYAASKDPHEPALLYAALGKKALLQGLFKSSGNKKVADFMSRNFTTPDGAAAASKNAFHLLGQHRFNLAAAFFILAGSNWDAVSVLAKEAADPQLALFVARLLDAAAAAAAAAQVPESSSSTAGPLQQRLVNEGLLLQAQAAADPAAAALLAWVRSSNGSEAVVTLLAQMETMSLAAAPQALLADGNGDSNNSSVAYLWWNEQQQQQLPLLLHWLLAVGVQHLVGKRVSGSVLLTVHNIAIAAARAAEVAGLAVTAAEAIAVADHISLCGSVQQPSSPSRAVQQEQQQQQQGLAYVLGMMWRARLAAAVLALGSCALRANMRRVCSSTSLDKAHWHLALLDELPHLQHKLGLQIEEPSATAALLARLNLLLQPVVEVPAITPGSGWCWLPASATTAAAAMSEHKQQTAGSIAGSSNAAAAPGIAGPDAALAICLSRTTSSTGPEGFTTTSGLSRAGSLVATAVRQAAPITALGTGQGTGQSRPAATSQAASKGAGVRNAASLVTKQQQQRQQQPGVLGVSWELARQDGDKFKAVAACAGTQHCCLVSQKPQQHGLLQQQQHVGATGGGGSRPRPLVFAASYAGICSSALCAPADLPEHVGATIGDGSSSNRAAATAPSSSQRLPVALHNSPAIPQGVPTGHLAYSTAQSSSSLSGFMSHVLEQLRWPPDPWVVGEFPHRRGSSSFGSANMAHVAAVALAAHPTRPLYVSGSSTGRIYLWQFGEATCKAAYVPVASTQMQASPRRLAAHEAVSTPHWGSPVAIRFSRSGARFGGVGEGGLVGLWRPDCISGVDGLGHAEWTCHCLSKAATGVAFLGDTGSQVLVSGVGDKGGAVVLVDSLAPPATSCVAQLLSPRGSTPTALTLVPGGSGGSGTGPGAVLVIGDDSGELRGFDTRVLDDKKPLWCVKAHEASQGLPGPGGVRGSGFGGGVTSLACWDLTLLGGTIGVVASSSRSSSSRAGPMGEGALGKPQGVKKLVAAAVPMKLPSWLGDLITIGNKDGSIAVLNAYTGSVLQVLHMAHYTERKGLLERVVGSRGVSSSTLSSSSIVGSEVGSGPVIRERPHGAIGAAVTGLEACSEGLISCGADGVLRFHPLAHILNEWAGGDTY